MALICLSRGHHGSGTRPPARHAGFVEDVVSRDIGAAAEDRLVELGHEVVVMSGFPYDDRHDRAKALGADVYVCLHLNAGYDPSAEDAYGLLLHDDRSRLGNLLAGHVGHHLAAACPELSRVAIVGAKSSGWTAGAFTTICGVFDGRPVGLCFEAGFIDAVEHASLWQAGGPARVGRALADGVHAYLESR